MFIDNTSDFMLKMFIDRNKIILWALWHIVSKMGRVKQMDDKFQNLKIMVIDDSKTIRRTAETLLQLEG